MFRSRRDRRQRLAQNENEFSLESLILVAADVDVCSPAWTVQSAGGLPLELVRLSCPPPVSRPSLKGSGSLRSDLDVETIILRVAAKMS